MGNEVIDEDIILENDDELEDLGYSGESPLFETVHVTKKDFSIYELYRKFNKGQLILEVDFQRSSVWKEKQKCELIESILMGLPLPIFYLKQMDNATYVIVDGKQRLSTLFDFIDNKFVLKSLKILKFLNGKKFKDLVEDFAVYQSQIEDYQLYSHIILPPTPDKILFDIFERVNRGGTQLNKQEIRNALYHGNGLDMIKEITQSDEFVDVTHIKPQKDIRMKGSYLITRFLAFFMYYEGEFGEYKYKGDIDELIEKALEKLNMEDENLLKKRKILISECLVISKEIFGNGAFRKELNSSKPINMNIFETSLYFIDLLIKSKVHISYHTVYDEFKNLIMTKEYLEYIGNSRDNPVKVNGRFRMIKKCYEEMANGK